MNFHEALAIGSLPVLMLMLFVGFPITFVFMFIGLLIGFFGMGTTVFKLLNIHFYQVMTDPIFLAIPFFLLMGFLLERAGLMDKLFTSFQRLLGPLPGSLYVIIIVTATLFAAATGIVGSSITLLCFMAAPALKKGGYNIPLGAGAIAGGGTLGILTPPSIMLVVIGPLVGVPVTNLFAAAIIPSLLLSTAYIGYALARSFINPKMGPPLVRGQRISFIVVRDLIIGIFPLLFLILSVLGSILAGIATPTEAAAVGAFGALVLLFIYRKFSLANFKIAIFSTAKISAMILIMIAACNFWGAVFSRMGGGHIIIDFLLSLHFHPNLIIAIIFIVVFLLGWAMEWVPIVLVIMPLTMPIIIQLNIDPLWYGIMFAVVLQTSWLTPPVALSCYFIKGCLPDWRLWDIYKGMLQFVVVQLVVIIILFLFPGIIVWLPSLIR